METNKIYQGDCLEILKTFPSESIDMCMTSPPYYGLRNYNIEPIIWGGVMDCEHEFELRDKRDPMDRGGKGDHDREGGLSGTKIDYVKYTVGYCKKCGAWKGNLGLEPSPQEYINHLIEIFEEVMRVLKKEGIFFLNIGDSYATHRSGKDSEINFSNEKRLSSLVQRNAPKKEFKSNWNQEKQKLLIPHRVAIALQEKGFIIRDDIVWVKKLNIFPDKISIGSTMPFPVKDKLLPSTEYIFQIVKSKKYFFNLENVKTQIKNSTIDRARRPISSTYTNDIEGNPYTKHIGMAKKHKEWAKMNKDNEKGKNGYTNWNVQGIEVSKANPTNAIMFRRMNQNSKRAVQEHFASYPISLTDYFVSVGCPKDGIVLDPFLGSGTTAISSLNQGKRFIGIEMNPKYIEIAEKRLKPYLEQRKLK